jgi:hypothetical protein
MINSEIPRDATQEERVARIVATGPQGALVLAGIATVIVIGIWFAFYLLVFLPRGALQ